MANEKKLPAKKTGQSTVGEKSANGIQTVLFEDRQRV